MRDVPANAVSFHSIRSLFLEFLVNDRLMLTWIELTLVGGLTYI